MNRTERNSFMKHCSRKRDNFTLTRKQLHQIISRESGVGGGGCGGERGIWNPVINENEYQGRKFTEFLCFNLYNFYKEIEFWFW